MKYLNNPIWEPPPQINPKIAFFDLNFTFRFPKSHKNPWVGSHIWENFPKKKRFSLDGTPKILNASVPWVSQTLSFRAQECEK